MQAHEGRGAAEDDAGPLPILVGLVGGRPAAVGGVLESILLSLSHTQTRLGPLIDHMAQPKDHQGVCFCTFEGTA